MRVAIIGAGVTGLYLAWKLAEKGEDVTVFEKRDKIGKETCSGLFSERILKFIPQSEKLIKNQINYVLIHFPRKTIRVDFARNFLIMDHAELDRLTAGLAQTSGAKIKLNETGPNPVSFDGVIGCDGANSVTRKSLSLTDPNYRLGILGFINETRSDRVSFVETWPVGCGFIWKIPRSEAVEYGIIAKPEDARKLLDSFCRENDLQLRDIKSALIPQGFIIPKNDKITLCGDAAGLTKPWSGGGVVWGLTAADLLLRNFPNFVRYQQAAKKLFLPQIIISKIAMKIVYFLGFKLPWLLPSRIKIDGDFIIL